MTTSPRLRVHNLSISLDGFIAGPDQSLEHPLGVGGRQLHEWVFATPYGQRMMGKMGVDVGGDDVIDLDPALAVDDAFMTRGDENIGAHILGRNMFGPIRGEWGDSDWTGWWGPEPPYHHAVFVLTHHAHDPIEMEGGTTFHFVTDGIESALSQAFEAAGDADVRIGGGAATVRQYLEAGLVDEMHLAFSPVLLGRGERVFDIDANAAGYECVELVKGAGAVHARFERKT
jgi:dihydrofolate reductase